MPLILILLFLLASVAGVFGGTIPLTAKEIALMLRIGLSHSRKCKAVREDLVAALIPTSIDSAIEEQLVKAGANAALIEALRSGTYQSSPSEMAAVREKLAALQSKAPEASAPSTQIEPEKQEKNASTPFQNAGHRAASESRLPASEGLSGLLPAGRYRSF